MLGYSQSRKCIINCLNPTDTQELRNKFYDIETEIVIKQLNNGVHKDKLVYEKIYSDLAKESFASVQQWLSTNKYGEIAFAYKTTIDLILRIHSKEIKTDELIEILGTAYYNRASFLYRMLNKKIVENFNLRSNKQKEDNGYSIFLPEEIEENFLNAELLCKLKSIDRSHMYGMISDMYCEIKHDYIKAKQYAIKSIMY